MFPEISIFFENSFLLLYHGTEELSDIGHTHTFIQ